MQKMFIVPGDPYELKKLIQHHTEMRDHYSVMFNWLAPSDEKNRERAQEHCEYHACAVLKMEAELEKIKSSGDRRI